MWDMVWKKMHRRQDDTVPMEFGEISRAMGMSIYFSQKVDGFRYPVLISRHHWHFQSCTNLEQDFPGAKSGGNVGFGSHLYSVLIVETTQSLSPPVQAYLLFKTKLF